MPGEVGDGGPTTVKNSLSGNSVDALMQKGKNPTVETLRRFLVGPADGELTGMAETPDGKALFVNVQHPGDSTKSVAGTFTSNWPGGGTSRPRSATIVITRKDGGPIGV